LGNGDAAWLRGSDLWVDTQLSVVLKRTPQTIAICYARWLSSADCLRLSIDDKDIRLQEYRNGAPVTIKVVPVPIGPELRVEWRIKGLRSWLNVNDVPVFGPLPLSAPRASGSIGFEGQGGDVTLTSVKVTPLGRRGVVVDSWMRIPVGQRALMSEYITMFPLPGEAVSAQQCLDCIQAVAEGAEVWPMLNVPPAGAAPEDQVELMVKQLSRQDVRAFIKGFVLEAAQKEWVEPLRAQGFGIMYRMKDGDPVPLSATNQLDHVWLDMAGTNAVQVADEYLHRHPPTQLVVQNEAVIRRFPRVDQVVIWSEPEGKNP
jgi:hypothetical protein